MFIPITNEADQERFRFVPAPISEETGLRFGQLSRYYKNQSAALAMIF